jgi:hypothetical protein
MGKICDGGRDLDGADWFEYCDSLFFEACEDGRCRFDLRAGGEVSMAVKGGWSGLLGVGEEEPGGGEVAGDVGSKAGDMTAAISAKIVRRVEDWMEASAQVTTAGRVD